MNTAPAPAPERKKVNEVKKKEGGSNKGGMIAFLITTLLFLGASAYLFLDNTKVKEETAAKAKTVDSLNGVKVKLLKEIEDLKAKLNIAEGSNRDLTDTILAMRAELEIKVKKIQSMGWQISNTKKLKNEVADLRKLRDTYSAKYDSLQKVIDSLIRENSNLTLKYNELNSQVGSLQEKNLSLEKKIQLASVLRATEVIVIGEKKGKGTKYAPTKMKKAERLLVTFTLDENKIADAGEKSIYITVTTPSGKVVENSESGSFTNADNNMATPYTLIYKVNYNNSAQKVAVPVDLTNIEHLPGNYTIDFYSDGYLAGSKKITIK